jgi:two-component sensor histidine kinase
MVVQQKLFITSYLAVLMLFAFSGPLTAQSTLDKEIDSLQTAIAKAAPDTAKINLHLAIIPKLYSRYLLNGNASADSLAFFQVINDCRSLSIQLRDAFAHGSSYIWSSYFHNLLGDHSKRDTLLSQAFSILRLANEKRGLASAYYFKAEMRAGISTDSARLIAYDSSTILAREAGDHKRQAQALRAIADIHRIQGKFDLAIRELLQILEIQKKNNDNRIHFTTDILAVTYSGSGNHKEALRNAIASINYSRKYNDTGLIVTFYQRLGYLYSTMYNYDKSYYYFDKALSSFMPGKPELVRQVTLSIISGMVGSLIKQGKYQECRQLIADHLKKYPVADERSLDFLHFLYLDLDIHTGNYKAAEQRLKLMLQHLEDWDFVKQFVIRLYTRAAQLYYKMNQFDKAAFYGDSANTLALPFKAWSVLMENSQILYQVDSIKGNYKDALKHHIVYKTMSDSIQKDVMDKQLAELAVQYETDQMNEELSLLGNRARLQQETIQQSRNLRNAMIGGSALLLLLLLVSWNRFRIKKKANLQLQEKQDEINWQNNILEKMVADEKKITEEKDKLLAEKEWLMKEINHRVKNNLQVVMSLLNTQSSYLKDEAALNAIQESRHRVHAISLIHRKLYQSEQLMTVIDMSAYIKEVIEYLSDNLNVENRIVFGLFIDPITLDVTQAVPMGLIINEAVTNSVKYAFPGEQKGQVNIYMYRTPDGRIELLISDNGIGLPENFDWQHTDSLGMSLMNGLSRQLDGTFEVVQKNGLTIKINFERSKSSAQ